MNKVMGYMYVLKNRGQTLVEQERAELDINYINWSDSNASQLCRPCNGSDII